MATQDLAGSVTTGSATTGLLDVSTIATNEPPSNAGSTLSYTDPSASTIGTVTSGTVDGLSNTANNLLTPFLRTTFASVYDGGIDVPRVLLTIPSTGLVQGDLMVLTIISGGLTPPAATHLPGWTMRASMTDASTSFTTSVWTDSYTASNAGLSYNLGSATDCFGQVRAYGNAAYYSTYITENAMGSAGQTATTGLSDAQIQGVVAYFWPGYYYALPNYRASIPPPLGNVALNNNATYVGCVSADLAVVDAIQPARTATLTSYPAFTTTQKVMQVAVVLAPLSVFRYSEVSIEEATGASQDTIRMESYLHILGADEHSDQISYGFTEAGMNDPGTGIVYSYERWVRVRFDPQFNTVRAFRFWAPNLASVPAGWSVNYGTVSSYETPVNTASSIAINPVPITDPGLGSPNAGGETRLAGTGTQYSDWIVLQASADTAVVGPGPVLGFSLEGTLIPIEFSFTWTET